MSQNRWIHAAAVAGLLLSMAQTGWAQLATTRIATGLLHPTYVTYLPGDNDRLFVLEQAGIIKIMKNGVLQSRVFLDIQGIVNDGGDEQGLLGLAFDPDYDTNKHFFVYYTGGSGAGTSVIRRFTVSPDPDSADVNSGIQIMVVQQNVPNQTNHKGGTILFDPQGFLRWGLGDGGSGGDPGENGQDGLELLGKILRIDPDGDDFPGDPLQNYAIPPTNPFLLDAGVRDEIWALGMRNPYRWTFDRLTGEMYIADVGQQSWEEIDYEPAGFAGGRNYGWDLTEGFHCFEPPSGCDDGDPVLTYPIHEYSSVVTNCSITGGVVYRGIQLPEIQGQYLFADYCSGKFWSILVNGGAVADTTEWTSQISPSVDGFTINQIVGVCDGNDGEVYIIDRGGTVPPSGSIFRLGREDDVGVDVEQPKSAAALELSRVNPNPFRNATSFDVQMSRAGNLEVGVYSASGRLLRRLHSGSIAAGRHVFTWDGSAEKSDPAVAGVYFIRAEALGSSATKRVTLLR